jgi:hypothetical protein
MTQNMAAERRPTWEIRQTGMLDKSLGTYNGVMPPIATIGAMPVGKTASNDGAIEAGRKLLRTGE